MSIKNFILRGNLVVQILIGLALGIVLGIFLPKIAISLSFLGDLFLLALKSAAPVLVFFLVISAITNHKSGQKTNIKSVILLYLIGTFLAAATAVIASFLFPSTLTLEGQESLDLQPPSGIGEVLSGILFKIVDNPVSAILNANFLGILAWAVAIGFFLKKSSDNTKLFFTNVSDALIAVIRVVIRFAPIGVMSLVAVAIARTGVDVLTEYLHIVCVLVGTMLFVALVVNPLVVFF